MEMFTLLMLYLISIVKCDEKVIKQYKFGVAQLKEHHTDMYRSDPKGNTPIIIRRGADFSFRALLMEQKTKFNVEVHLTFSTRFQGDKIVVVLPNSESESNGWKLTQEITDKDIKVKVHIPGTAAVGTWAMEIIIKDKDGKKVEHFDVSSKIIILFNPWSQEDPAYFPDAEKLSEYVLAENGLMYKYDSNAWLSMPWIFGQFQQDVLDAILFALNKAELWARERGDIVKVTRALTYLMNEGDDEHSGVLVGKWQEPYDGTLNGHPTTSPFQWTGSPAILKQYYLSNGMAVGYGQCWVFAGILTTALRSLGIAARPVANAESAHDDEADLTLDVKLNEDGTVNLDRSDTLWNYHEWVEAWFRRDDLKMTKGEWQELDATPQAEHDNEYQVGPTSISQIFSSKLKSNYETSYLYSEVNADVVVWSIVDDEYQISEIKTNAVGLSVVTKKVGSEDYEDITSSFKPPEGTEEERKSYKDAAESLGITPPSLTKSVEARSKNNRFFVSILPVQDVEFGSSVKIRVLLKSSYYSKNSVSLLLKASSIYYNGMLKSVIKSETRNVTINFFQKKKVHFSISSIEYIKHLSDERRILIEAVALHEQNVYRDIQRISIKPLKVKIQVPKTVEFNSTFKMKICFKNPLNETLKDIRIAVEGKGIDREVFKISDVNALSMSNTVIRLSSKYLGLETVVVDVFNPNIKETITKVAVNVSIQKKHLLAPRHNAKKMKSNGNFVVFSGYDKLRK